jgi:hypothetical protein
VLAQAEWGKSLARARTGATLANVKAGNLVVKVAASPLVITVEGSDMRTVQEFTFDATAPGFVRCRAVRSSAGRRRLAA